METQTELLPFFKALADEKRLQIVGLLARESLSGEQLAAILKVKPATISHHLAKLAEAGLVSGAMEGHSKPYTLRLDAIHAMAERLLAGAARETLPEAAAGLDSEAYDRKVVKDFLKRDGSLKEIPAQQKKLQAVLRHIRKQFKPGRDYGEKEVNAILARFHPDTSSLRRDMISYRLLNRDAQGRRYWRDA
jgi:hypothetical protein